MSVIVKGEYLGMPVPGYDEVLRLQDALHSAGYNGITVEKISQAVREFRPAISEYIFNDKKYFCELNNELDDNELDKFLRGIDGGYEFVIGCLTYVNYLRSGHEALGDYLADKNRTRREVPLWKMSQARRVNMVQKGEAAIDFHAHSNTSIESSDISVLEARTFSELAKDFAELFEIKKIFVRKENEENGDVDEDMTELYIDGMEQGFENAICMYVQSWEELSLSSLKKRLSGI